MKYRIGMGYDVHRLAADESLWLGGVLIPHNRGTVAHSDGDVLIHAVCDALLGAAALGNIGILFPDTSDEFKNIDSKELLKRTTELVNDSGYTIENIDSVIIAQTPLLNPFVNQMESCMAGVLGIEQNRVSVKATTTERLGFEGREEGISAQAVALIMKIDG